MGIAIGGNACWFPTAAHRRRRRLYGRTVVAVVVLLLVVVVVTEERKALACCCCCCAQCSATALSTVPRCTGRSRRQPPLPTSRSFQIPVVSAPPRANIIAGICHSTRRHFEGVAGADERGDLEWLDCGGRGGVRGDARRATEIELRRGQVNLHSPNGE
eukprot:COSAG02_NODE_2102_length_9824_cov_62.567609_3_plen_159_part_00